MEVFSIPLKRLLRTAFGATALAVLASACDPNEQAVPDPATPPKPRVEPAPKPAAGDTR